MDNALISFAQLSTQLGQSATGQKRALIALVSGRVNYLSATNRAGAMKAIVRKASMCDSTAIAAIHREAFARQQNSEQWIAATLAAEPRFYCCVVEVHAEIVGYIFWAQKSGIRPEAVLELDQVAVLKRYQGLGYAEQLIRESMALVEQQLAKAGQKIKAVLVSTRADNLAQRLYTRVLGVKTVAQIDDLYSAAEVIMISKR